MRTEILTQLKEILKEEEAENTTDVRRSAMRTEILTQLKEIMK